MIEEKKKYEKPEIQAVELQGEICLQSGSTAVTTTYTNSLGDEETWN